MVRVYPHPKIFVAPRTGAWIETRMVYSRREWWRVAPRTGAGIETYCTPSGGQERTEWVVQVYVSYCIAFNLRPP